ncbi:histone-lysine N-methyltransferase SETD1B-like [Salvia divinorum]
MSSPYVKIGNRTVDQLKVTELREELKRRKLTSSGLKQDLVKRLDEAVRIEMESSLEKAEEESTQSEVPIVKENAVTDVNDSAKAFTGRDIDIVEKIDDYRGLSGEGKVIETGLVQGTESAGLEGGQVPEPSFVETTEVEKITEPVKISKESNSQDHGTNEEGDATILLNVDGTLQEDAKAELSAPNTQSPQINESRTRVAALNEQNTQGTETQNEGIHSTNQRENDDSSCLQPGSSVQTLKYQVSAVDPNLGFQVTSDSVSTESVSIIEKNELKIDVINDNVKLELDVKHEMVQQSPSVAVPDGGESHPMDVEEPLDKNDVKDDLDIKHVKEPIDRNDVKVDLDIKDVEELHDVKSIDSGDVDPPEKLSLDRSSGDDSMEEDIMESKQMDGKSDLFIENVKNFGTPSVKEEDHVDVVGHDKPVEMEITNVENETASVLTSMKRKFQDKEAVGNNDAGKKVRRWNAEGLKSSEPQSGSITPKGSSEPSFKPITGANSLANVEEATKERVVPPSSKPPTNSLRIDRFLRPFTLKAVQELLGKTGTVTSFWMDHIKTHCFVSYSSVEEAIETRNAVYNLQWPTNGGRLLFVEFVDPQEVKSRVEAPLASPAAPSPTTVPTQPPSAAQPSPRQQLVKQQIPPPLPPPTLSNPPPQVRERLHPPREAMAREQPLPARDRLNLPPPPPLPLVEKVDPPIVTLDDLFRKTKATPRIYYLPLSDEVVASKLKTQGKNVTQ